MIQYQLEKNLNLRANLRLLFEINRASENSQNWTKIRLQRIFRDVFSTFTDARCAQIRLRIFGSTKDI